MPCKFCGSILPAGARACPTCGNMVDAIAQGHDEPTQYVSAADINPPQTPYNSPTNINPPQTPYNSPTNINPAQTPYDSPTEAIPPSPYGTGIPPYQQSSSTPYRQPYPSQGVPSYQQPYQQYSSPMNSQSGVPYANNAAYPGHPGAYAPPAQKPKSRVGLIIGMIALVLIVLCVGGSVLAYLGSQHTTQTNTTHATETAVTTSQNTPSGTPIDPQAAAIIIHPQTATAIDKGTLKPAIGKTSSTFQTYASIYVTFELDPKQFDASKETDYINARFYIGSKSILKDEPLKIGAGDFNGYFSANYYTSTDAGAVELYWCHTATCSDGKLAQVVHFTVTK